MSDTVAREFGTAGGIDAGGASSSRDLWGVAPVLRQARLQLGPDATIGDIGELLGVPGATVGQWSGPSRPVRLRGRRAEEIAHALGVEPVMLWPDWYGPELVDVWWICEQFNLGRSWVQNYITKRVWFPAEVPRARRAARWPGHQNARVWERWEVEEAMAAHGYGPNGVGMTAKELALQLGVAYQTVIGWSNTFDDFPEPVVHERPRRWLPDHVEQWLEMTSQNAHPWFGGSLRRGMKREPNSASRRAFGCREVA